MSSSSTSGSPSATFTVKQKRVKFVDGDSAPDNNSQSDKMSKPYGSTALAADSKDDSPVNVEFTISMKKPRPTVSDTSRNSNQEDYQSRIKELSQELSKAKEKIDVLEAKNKEIDSMVSALSGPIDGTPSIDST